MISFARGVPAPELLPVADLADCARAVLERDGATALNYGPAGGYAPLRRWLAERHGVGAGEIVLTNGSLQGLDLLVAHYAGERRLLLEAPTYDRALRVAARHGADVACVPHDDEGIDPDALESELRRDPRPALLYVLPTFQNPTGRTISLDRRRQLLELAAASDLLVIEDDPYRLVRYDGEDLPSLHELGGGERVLHASSFSKIVAPGLRVGYLVVPADVASSLEAVAADTYLAPTFPTQAILFEYLDRGLLEPNLAVVREQLQIRRDVLFAALEEELPGGSWNEPAGGYFLWLELPGGVDARDALVAAESAGVTFVAGADFFLRDGGESAARIAFSSSPIDQIDEGVRLLASACGALIS